MNKAKQFRELLAADKPIVIAGAHNGLSGRLVEEAGFDGIWGSGFEISGSHAIPDANILTMAENLHVTKNMNDSASIPVIADCDNGYGNAINVMRMVEEYEKAGIAGVCIEDNVFPKRCSFYSSVKRELESIDEFAGKIRAAKRAQRSSDFVVIARTEALIAGWGMEEALKRGRAFAEAGADLVLIHSKKSSPQEVMTFASQWDLQTPLVCVPTTYNTASVEELHAAGFKMVIFANHGLRAAIKNMQETLAELRQQGRASAIDERIAPMTEVYRLMGVDDLQANEAEYLPTDTRAATAVIVAAGKGFEDELMPLIADRPKSLLNVKGKTILQRQIETLHRTGIRKIAVVRGYKKEMLAPLPDVRYFDNDRHAETNTLESFFCAEEVLKGRVIALYGDILFDESILEKLLKSEADITLVVDHAKHEAGANGNGQKRISHPEMVKTARRLADASRFVPDATLNSALKIGRDLSGEEANAEFIGMAMFSEKGIETLKQVYRDAKANYAGKPFHEAKTFEQASFSDVIQELIARDIEIACLDIYKGWMEVDTFDDYKKMWAEIEA
jgi:phosphoenolpyruvate phosphomutase